MGARAHSRRHEGRRIRKAGREMAAVAARFQAFGQAAGVAGNVVNSLGESFRGWSEQIALWREQQAATLTLSRVGSPYPTQSGVEGVRTAQGTADKVDATAARMGLELTPWQRELAIAVLGGIPIQVNAPTRGGKVAVAAVVNEIRGVEVGDPIIDELTHWKP